MNFEWNQHVSPFCEIDLPRPPSVNRYKSHLGNQTPVVKTWMGEADYFLWLARRLRPGQVTPVRGAFAAEIVFSRPDNRKRDLDNGIKPLLDWLQRVELIENDKFLDDLHVTWGKTPRGAFVRLWEI